jgi:K+-transporting ATPase KdpF subunit
VGLRPAEVEGEKSMLGNIILLAISILTFVYLVAALLWPERF